MLRLPLCPDSYTLVLVRKSKGMATCGCCGKRVRVYLDDSQNRVPRYVPHHGRRKR